MAAAGQGHKQISEARMTWQRRTASFHIRHCYDRATIEQQEQAYRKEQACVLDTMHHIFAVFVCLGRIAHLLWPMSGRGQVS
jgi:hypothetical protein